MLGYSLPAYIVLCGYLGNRQSGAGQHKRMKNASSGGIGYRFKNFVNARVLFSFHLNIQIDLSCKHPNQHQSD